MGESVNPHLSPEEVDYWNKDRKAHPLCPFPGLHKRGLPLCMCEKLEERDEAMRQAGGEAWLKERGLIMVSESTLASLKEFTREDMVAFGMWIDQWISDGGLTFDWDMEPLNDFLQSRQAEEGG